MNKILTLFHLSKINLLRNKGRSFLSVLGVMIGVATVLSVMSIGESIKGLVINQVNSFGTDWVQAEVKVPSTEHASSENAGGIAQGVTITTLKIDDAEAVKKLENIKDYYGGILSQNNVNYQDYNSSVMVFGVSAPFLDIDAAAEIAQGRFYTDEEERSLSRVVVLGSKITEEIFGDENPIGKTIRIERSNYKIIGVMAERGASFFIDFDSMVFVPLRTVQKLILGVDYVTYFIFQVRDGSQIENTSSQVADVIRDRHDITDPKKDDFAVSTPQSVLGILGTVTGAISILLLLIASVSLIVGSVGIMNIMLVSVAERVPEIGLRKAVGATSKNIQHQFLTESVLITSVGGMLGVVFGLMITGGVALLANKLGLDWPMVFQFRFFLIAVGVSLGVGLAAGIYPAQKAAKLDPIVALGRE
jgi:putative ABC transport system permease protein